MKKALIGLVGIVFLSISIYTLLTIRSGEQKAAALNDKKQAFGYIPDDVPPPCSWEVTSPEQVMSENKSQAVVVKTSNKAKKNCQTILSLRAPGFETSPANDEQKITLPSGEKGSLSWIITPRKTGTYDIAVSDILNTSIFGITVTNMFGLTATQAKVFSVLGSLFGPMLTVPWWWDRLRQRKNKQPEGKKEEQQSL